MRQTRIWIGTDLLLQMARHLVDSGELQPEQFAEMERRNKKLSPMIRENIIISEQGGKNEAKTK